MHQEFDKLTDKYGFVIDDPTSVKKRPPGDSTWRSSWLYFAYCVIGAKSPNNIWPMIVHDYSGDPIGQCAKFLDNFVKYCIKQERLDVHPEADQQFSRDQLSPLLLLCAAVNKYQPHLQSYCHKILEKIIKLDDHFGRLNHGAKNEDDRAELNPAIRYPLKVVAKMYGLEASPYVYECMFQGGLFANECKYKYKFGGHNKEHYAVWDQLGQLTACVIGERSKALRKHFAHYAHSNWGVGYRIVANKSYSQLGINSYKNIKKHYCDIQHQRGPNPKHEPGDILCLDWPILKALEIIWR